MKKQPGEARQELKIMIVDDSAFMRAIIKKIVGGNGARIIEAADGKQAVELYKKENPALTLMDVVMPNLSGVEALKQIRAIDPNARIIMVSAAGQEMIIKEALDNGAYDFIVKPFKEEQVQETIAKALGER